jgi:hypothetical protein
MPKPDRSHRTIRGPKKPLDEHTIKGLAVHACFLLDDLGPERHTLRLLVCHVNG